jgi:hypothetical protein
LFIRKVSGNQYEMEIEGDVKIISESEVPPEIRAKALYSQKTDITQEAREVGVLRV